MCTCEETVFHFPDGRQETQRRYHYCRHSKNQETCGAVNFLKPEHRYVPGAPTAVSPPVSPVSHEHRGHRVSIVEPKSSSPLSEATGSSSASGKKNKDRSQDTRRIVVKEPKFEFQFPFLGKKKGKKEDDKEKTPPKKRVPEPEVVIHHHHHAWEPLVPPEAPEPPSAASPRSISPTSTSHGFYAGFGSPVLPPSPESTPSVFGSYQGSDITERLQNQPVYQERIPPSRRFSQPEPLSFGQSSLHARASRLGEVSSRPNSQSTEGSNTRPDTSAGVGVSQLSNLGSEPVAIPGARPPTENIATSRDLHNEATHRHQQDVRISQLEEQLRQAQEQLEKLHSMPSGVSHHDQPPPEAQPEHRPRSQHGISLEEPSQQEQQAQHPPPRRDSVFVPIPPASQTSTQRNRQTEANTIWNSRTPALPFHRRASQLATPSHETSRPDRAHLRQDNRGHRHHRSQGPPILHQYPANQLPYPQRPRREVTGTSHPSSVRHGPPAGRYEHTRRGHYDSGDPQEVQARISYLQDKISTLRRSRQGVEEDLDWQITADAHAEAAQRERDRHRLGAYESLSGGRRARNRPMSSSPTSEHVSSPSFTSFETSSEHREPERRELERERSLRHSRGASTDLRGMFHRSNTERRRRRTEEAEVPPTSEDPVMLPGPWERERRRY